MPEGLPPMCGTEEFAELMAEMVAEDAPRLFAVVQEFGERVDAKQCERYLVQLRADSVRNDQRRALQLAAPLWIRAQAGVQRFIHALLAANDGMSSTSGDRAGAQVKGA